MSNVEDGVCLPPPRCPPFVLCSTAPVSAHPSDQPPTVRLSTLKAALGSGVQMKVLEAEEKPGGEGVQSRACRVVHAAANLKQLSD